jgi:hypothetical protein
MPFGFPPELAFSFAGIPSATGGREVYGAMDMGWAKLVGQVAHAYGK